MCLILDLQQDSLSASVSSAPSKVPKSTCLKGCSEDKMRKRTVQMQFDTACLVPSFKKCARPSNSNNKSHVPHSPFLCLHSERQTLSEGSAYTTSPKSEFFTPVFLSSHTLLQETVQHPQVRLSVPPWALGYFPGQRSLPESLAGTCAASQGRKVGRKRRQLENQSLCFCATSLE